LGKLGRKGSILPKEFTEGQTIYGENKVVAFNAGEICSSV
jgi:hypothetical protein